MKDFPWGYIVGAAVTVIGLLFNQWRSDRREIDRWAKEVQRDQEKWERERAERLEQWRREDHARVEQWRREDERRWFDERRALYAQLLKTGREFIDTIRSGARRPVEADSVLIDKLFAADDKYQAAASEVAVIASDLVSGRVTELTSTCMDAMWSVISMKPPKDSDDVAAAVELTEAAYENYFSSVRQDLGISAPADGRELTEAASRPPLPPPH